MLTNFQKIVSLTDLAINF